jgi:uncharacterized SAM-binding protein YcdF (DUF218 family)
MVTYIILGYILKKNNKIHPILKKRLDSFIKLYKKGDKVILCGGNTAKTTHTEAYVMSKYIHEKTTINKKDIILENKSLDTNENINFLMKILIKNKINNVTLITSSWHMKRVRKIVKYFNENKIVFLYRSSRALYPTNKDEKKMAKDETKKMKLFNKLF